MFFDRLWVRLKGELLALKEDLTDEWEGRDKALDLLDKLETTLRGSEGETAPEDPAERLDKVAKQMGEYRKTALQRGGRETELPSLPDAHSVEELERVWEELRSLRKKKSRPDREKPKDPRPRRLG